MNAKEALRPVMIETGGLKVAIFAYYMYDSSWMGYVEFATEEKDGVNPLRIDKSSRIYKKRGSCMTRAFIGMLDHGKGDGQSRR